MRKKCQSCKGKREVYSESSQAITSCGTCDGSGTDVPLALNDLLGVPEKEATPAGAVPAVQDAGLPGGDDFVRIEDRLTALQYIDMVCNAAAGCWSTYFDYSPQASVEAQKESVRRLVRNLGHCLQAWPRNEVIKAQYKVWNHVVMLTGMRPPVDAKQVYGWLKQALDEDVRPRSLEDRLAELELEAVKC